jgi:excinuclease ABC subunit C
MVARIARLEAVVCDSAHEAAWLERNLLQASLPPWNRAPSGGQEKEVWIRLSESARAPGVTVVHRPTSSPGVRHFGPYLGGLQVRRAVSGLSRALPLAYAGGPPSGARQEMARALGVSAAERDGLAQAVAAVLERDPAAVRGGRLSGWGQHACDRAAARQRLRATPTDWVAFARRNAELAAKLAAGDERRPTEAARPPVSRAGSPGRNERDGP